MIRRKSILWSVVVTLFILIMLYCAVNPVTGKKELMLITEQDEIALGKQTDEEIAQTYGIYESPELTEYINRLGQDMSKRTHRPALEYHFKVLDTPVINAFAVPGGYVEGNIFFHPVLKFTFNIPAGWEVNNTPSQVQIVSKDQDAVMLLSMEDSPSAEQAADNFVQKTSASVQSKRFLTVNGFQTEKIVASMVSDEDTLQTMSYFIAKGGSVYAFHGIAGYERFSGYSSTFSRTLGGFRNLADPSKINITPRKLAVRSVLRTGSLGTVLKQFGAQDSELENLAVLNGMQLTDNMTAGMLIKVVMK